MTGIGRDEPNSLRASMAPIRVAEIGSYKCSSALTATWISLSKRSRVKTKRASKAPIYMRTHLMGKRRKEHPEDNIFVNKPFIEELSDWTDSPEGELWTEICDTLDDLLKDVQLDANSSGLMPMSLSMVVDGIPRIFRSRFAMVFGLFPSSKLPRKSVDSSGNKEV